VAEVAEVSAPSAPVDTVTLFLSGDVMTGRGIDQVLPHPSAPRLYEPYLNSALAYVEIAERVNGPVPRPAAFEYPWGDALHVLAHVKPDARIVNLETAVTTSDQPWPQKGINYRMHPANVRCLTAAGLDCCVLANNHVLDWGHGGLAETLDVLRGAGIRTAGAGAHRAGAQAPAVLEVGPQRRVLVFAMGSEDSGIPAEWAAHPDRGGVELLPDFSERTVDAIASRIAGVRRRGDLVVASVHWGSNWGYHVPDEHRRFAHALVERAGVDVVHGHSSHHPRPIEVHRGRLILYGCGDLINDYEGIEGYELFRGDLSLMYFVTLEAGTGLLQRLDMAPMRMQRFRLNRAGEDDAKWLAKTLDRETKSRFDTRIRRGADGWLHVVWEAR
jgi:poly-gamma-glutamate synthesis protein (capsule biosynthesis protein)